MTSISFVHLLIHSFTCSFRNSVRNMVQGAERQCLYVRVCDTEETGIASRRPWLQRHLTGINQSEGKEWWRSKDVT